MCLGRKDGEAVDVEARTWSPGAGGDPHHPDGHQPRSSGSRSAEIRELTEREQTDRRLRELIEAAPDAIIQVDQEGRIVILNAVTEKMFGYTREELLGQSVDMGCCPTNSAAHMWAIAPISKSIR